MPLEPFKPIDWDTFDKLCELNCTREEIAAFFGMSEAGITDACHAKHNMTFLLYHSQKAKLGNIALRRSQMRSAIGFNEVEKKLTKRKIKRPMIMNGEIVREKSGKVVVEEIEEMVPVTLEVYHPPSSTMQVWLGKQVLKQQDFVVPEDPSRSGDGTLTPFIVTVKTIEAQPIPLEDQRMKWYDQNPNEPEEVQPTSKSIKDDLLDELGLSDE